MRCPDCNKFVAFDEQEPEVQVIEVDEDGHVRVEVRIVNACADCSQELKDATFELEADHEIEGHKGEGHELSIEEDGCERTGRSGYFKKGKFVPACGRYAKTFYGVNVAYSISCSCGKLEGVSGTVEDEVQGSGMEELT